MQPCGTHGAYQRHKRRGEQPCEPCRLANAAYAQSLRDRPGCRVEENARQAARSRALRRLGQEYSDRYRVLVGEELAALTFGDRDGPA